MAGTKDGVSVVLPLREDKKHVVKFETNAEGGYVAISNIYISKTAVQEIGNPQAVRVTVTAEE